jgi:hypothetical protein
MKVRNKRNGGTVDVDDALAGRLDTALWEPVQAAAPKKAAKKAPAKKAAKKAG